MMKNTNTEGNMNQLKRVAPGLYVTADGAWEIVRGEHGSTWAREWVARGVRDTKSYSDPLPTLARAKEWLASTLAAQRKVAVGLSDKDYTEVAVGDTVAYRNALGDVEYLKVARVFNGCYGLSVDLVWGVNTLTTTPGMDRSYLGIVLKP